MVVKRGAFVEQVIRADDRGIASGVAAADPALFQDGDIRQTVFLGQIVRRTETVTAAAEDDGVVACLGFGLAPLRLPAAMLRQAVPDQRQSRKRLSAHIS